LVTKRCWCCQSSSGQRTLGALAFGAAEERPWPDEIVTQLRLVAEVLANALARKQTEDALRASEAMKSSILHSLRSGVAVVDREGTVLALNENWTRLANESGEPSVEVGNRLFGDRLGGGTLSTAHQEIGHAIHSVIQGRRDSFGYEYVTRSGKTPRWWAVVVDPLERPDGGAVVTRADVTDLRRAELDVQRVRQELAHVGRVSYRRRADGVARARALSAADCHHDQRAGGPADAQRVNARCLSG
jgi:PAS domain-containing protein